MRIEDHLAVTLEPLVGLVDSDPVEPLLQPQIELAERLERRQVGRHAEIDIALTVRVELGADDEDVRAFPQRFADLDRPPRLPRQLVAQVLLDLERGDHHSTSLLKTSSRWRST